MADQLIQQLTRHGIDPSRFGTATTKSLEMLRAEIDNGEARLVERDGKLIRRLLGVLNVHVFHEGSDGRSRLVEDRQEFAGGKVRSRGLPASVSEKLKPGETLPDAVARALNEELGVHKFAIVSPFRETLAMRESPAYGLLSEYPIHSVDVLLADSEYHSEYREVQSDKTTFFRWRRV